MPTKKDAGASLEKKRPRFYATFPEEHMDSTRFVSIRLFEPDRVQVVNLAQVVAVDVHKQACRATANLADGSQVRGTLHQMWPLLEVVGFKTGDLSAAGTAREFVDGKASIAHLDAENGAATGKAEETAQCAAEFRSSSRRPSRSRTEETAQCAAEFEAMLDHYAVQIEDEEIMQAARELAEEEAATATLRQHWEKNLRKDT